MVPGVAAVTIWPMALILTVLPTTKKLAGMVTVPTPVGTHEDAVVPVVATADVPIKKVPDLYMVKPASKLTNEF